MHPKACGVYPKTNTKKRPSTILPRWRSSARSALAGSWMAGRRGAPPARTDVPYVPVRHQSGGVGPGGRSLPASQSSWEHVKLDQVTRSRSWAPTSTRGPSATTGWWTGRGLCRRRRLCGAGSRTSSTNDTALPAGWNSPNRSWHGQPALWQLSTCDQTAKPRRCASFVWLHIWRASCARHNQA